MASWKKEFDLDFDVPQDAIDALATLGLNDESWHNDTSPKFAKTLEQFELEVWIDHPDPDRRETQRRRYQVVLVATFPESSDHGYTLLLTDDQDAMLTFVRGIIEAQ